MPSGAGGAMSEAEFSEEAADVVASLIRSLIFLESALRGRVDERPAEPPAVRLLRPDGGDDA